MKYKKLKKIIVRDTKKETNIVRNVSFIYVCIYMLLTAINLLTFSLYNIIRNNEPEKDIVNEWNTFYGWEDSSEVDELIE